MVHTSENEKAGIQAKAGIHSVHDVWGCATFWFLGVHMVFVGFPMVFTCLSMVVLHFSMVFKVFNGFH